MKTKLYLVCLSILLSCHVFAQYEYDTSNEFPYGLPNPKAPEQIKDYQEMIGKCDCKSISRNQDGTWADPIDMIWRWKYIMNGMAVQDETLKSDGIHSGSIRQFNADSSKWYVHYYSSKGIPKTLPAWEGNKVDGKIVLYRENKAPNGTDGFLPTNLLRYFKIWL